MEVLQCDPTVSLSSTPSQCYYYSQSVACLYCVALIIGLLQLRKYQPESFQKNLFQVTLIGAVGACFFVT